MADNTETTENENLEEVITSVDAWIESETGSSAVLCVRTTISGSDGLVGYGIRGISGYIGNGKEESEIIGGALLNGAETVVDGTYQWNVPKTHEGWTATCYAKSEGEVIFNDYVFSNRLKVPKAVKQKYKLRGNKELSFADAAKNMGWKSFKLSKDEQTVIPVK